MSFTNPVGPTPLGVNTNLANRNPEIYGAALSGQWNPEERFVINNIQNLLDLDKDLARTRDLDKAKQKFRNLDPEVQGALVFLNPNAEYQLEDKNLFKKVLGGVADFVKTPLRGLIDQANAYINLTPPAAPYRVLRSVFDTGDDKNFFEKVLTKKTWSDAWNGVNQWDSVATKKLEEKYGRAMSTLAKGIADGKKPSEIMREYGQLDADMANAVSQLSGNTDNWKKAFAEHKAYQVNIGNDYTNWANNNHPPKDGGAWSVIIASTLGAFPLPGMNEVTASKDGEKWLVSNPNIFSKEEYVSPSGAINFTAAIAFDPLTYLTGGTSRALTQSGKLAEKFNNSSKSTIQKVDELFQVPEFASYHARLAQDIAELREARRARNYVKAGTIRNRIANNFPEYDEDGVINLLTNTKVLDDAENLVYVTDLPTIQKFFQRGEYANYLINSKVNGGMYYRENNVALERRTRSITDGLRSMYDQVFNGIDRRVLEGQAPIPEKVYDNWLEFEKYFADQLKIRQSVPGFEAKLIDPNKDDIIKTLTNSEKNFKKAVSNAFAIQPAQKQIFYKDGYVERSLNDFRNFTRLLVGDKLIANSLTERYLAIEPDERLNMLHSLYNLYLDKIGFSNTASGIDRKRAILDGIFGGQGFGPIPEFKIPAQMDSPLLANRYGGPSQILHTTPGISMLNFDELFTEVYKLNQGNVNQLLRYKGTGGITNNAISRAANKAWAFLLLVPDLGWKSAADNALVFNMTAQPKQIVAYFTGKGKAMSKAIAAWSGSEKTQGLVKSRILDIFDRNPAKYVSPEKRKEMQALQKIDTSYTLPSGRTIKTSELVSADELFGASFEERLAATIMAKYGTKLDEESYGYMAELLMYNNQSIESMIQSTVAANFANTLVDGSLAAEIYGKSTLSEALEAAGRKATGTFKTDVNNSLLDADRNLVHFSSFYKYFGKNIWKNVDFGSLFIRYGALKTANDVTSYVDDVMQRIGYKKSDTGKWTVPPENAKRVKEFNSEFGKSSNLKAAGLKDSEITESIVRYSAAEMYTVFHGSSDKFNDALYSAITGKIQSGLQSVAKSREFRGKDAMRRNAIGEEQVTLTPKEIARRQKVEMGRGLASGYVRNMPFQEFEELTKGFGLQGVIKTDIDFKTMVDPVAWYKNRGNILWEAMDRQINDLFSTDGFAIKYIDQRKMMKTEQTTYEASLIKEGMSPENAAIQASIYFQNKASKNAADEILKYVDNPDVKTQLAFNLRVAGRFYRAVEDYARRLVRFSTRHPERVLYRLGHFSQAMDGSGMTYTDDNGTEYVLIPNDGLFWRTVAPAFAAIMNPLGSAQAILGQNWDFFKQPAWNQYTLKISMLNPGYAEGSGLPTLTGPTIAVPVLGARQLLNTIGTRFGSPLALEVGEELDNWLLGPQSDNTTWLRGLIPTNLLNAWGTLPLADKTGAMATGIYQMGAYLQINENTRLKPEDYGDEKKLGQYYDRLRLGVHNVIATKLGFNILSPIPLGTTEPGIPSELREIGIVSFRQEFSDILRGVLSVNAEYGYNLQDPIGTAVSIFAKENPDKLVYTVSKNSQQAKTAINYTQETKKWAIDNIKLLKDYPTVGWVFAPHIGEYDPSVMYFLQAADLIPEKDNVFDNNNQVLRRYLTELAAVKDRQKYFDVDREVQRLLNDPENPDRNNYMYRKDLMEKGKNTKEMIKAGNAALKEVLLNSDWENRQSLQGRFNNLNSMVNDPEVMKLMEKQKNDFVLSNLQKMTALTNRMLVVFEDTKIRGQFGSEETLEKIYRDGIGNLENIASANLTLGHAYTNIIRPLLDDVYSTPTVAIART
jgi:hypothetical protein